MTELINELREQLKQKDAINARQKAIIARCAQRLVHEYAENGSATTQEVAINAVGEREFYALLLEGGYDLNANDREDIVSLLR